MDGTLLLDHAFGLLCVLAWIAIGLVRRELMVALTVYYIVDFSNRLTGLCLPTQTWTARVRVVRDWGGLLWTPACIHQSASAFVCGFHEFLLCVCVCVEL